MIDDVAAEAGVELISLRGEAIRRHLDALASLRIEVFAEFPYLYRGTAEYERKYLAPYCQHPTALVVIARATSGPRRGGVVGASTAMPLRLHGVETVAPLAAAGLPLDDIYYFGESVLAPEYRGRGLGHAFFDAREQAAAQHGFAITAFCAIERPADHPRRPAEYRGLEPFWRKRGYVRHDSLRAQFSWQDLDEATESTKELVFWLRGA